MKQKTQTLLASSLALLVTAGAQAGVPCIDCFHNVTIPAGTEVACSPFPSIETIKNATVFQGDKPALTQVMTCKVSNGQTIPAQSTFVGELVAGSALGPYSFVWQRLSLPGTGGSIELDIADDELLSSKADNNGQLRLTFKRDLAISPATATTN